MAIDLGKLIRDTDNLTSLPASVGRLHALLAREDWTMSELERVIALDQVLTVRLLHLANSVALGGARAVESVGEAVQRLGAMTVVNVATLEGVGGSLQQPLPSYRAGEGALFRHSMASLLAVEAMRNATRVPIPAAAFSAALLHDIGKLLLCQNTDSEYTGWIQRACEEGGLSRLEAEEEILEVQHGELGALMAMHWGLPEAIVAGIKYHHDPDNPLAEPHTLVCRVTALASCVAKSIGAAIGDDRCPRRTSRARSAARSGSVRASSHSCARRPRSGSRPRSRPTARSRPRSATRAHLLTSPVAWRALPAHRGPVPSPGPGPRGAC